MYTIEKPKDEIYCYDFNKLTFRLIIKCIAKNEKELIMYLAKGFYRDSWGFLKNKRMENQYYDGYGRQIDPHIYYNSAHLLWVEKYKNLPPETTEQIWKKWKKNKTYRGEFRREPVEGIRKRRGGQHVRPRKIKHIAAMYSNPEFKEFNRGSRNDYPDGWWDDWYRVRERNWKSQRRHQWKEK